MKLKDIKVNFKETMLTTYSICKVTIRLNEKSFKNPNESSKFLYLEELANVKTLNNEGILHFMSNEVLEFTVEQVDVNKHLMRIIIY